jgi:hypothetical protein
MYHVTAGIKKLLVLHLVYLSISRHPSVSLMECPFLYLWCNSHLFLCDGITICLSVTTVICISVTVFTFFFVTTVSYLSITEHLPTCLQHNIHLCVCDRTFIYLSVKEHPSVFCDTTSTCFCKPKHSMFHRTIYSVCQILIQWLSCDSCV